MPKGLSVLEASLRNGIPHASVAAARPVLHVRIRGRRRSEDAAAAVEAGRASCSSARAPRRSRRPPRVPVAPGARPRVLLVFPPKTDASTCVPRAGFAWARNVRRQHVRRHARVRPGWPEKRLLFDTMFIINRFVAAASGGSSSRAGGRRIRRRGMFALFGLDTRACDREPAGSRRARGRSPPTWKS